MRSCFPRSPRDMLSGVNHGLQVASEQPHSLSRKPPFKFPELTNIRYTSLFQEPFGHHFLFSRHISKTHSIMSFQTIKYIFCAIYPFILITFTSSKTTLTHPTLICLPFHCIQCSFVIRCFQSKHTVWVALIVCLHCSLLPIIPSPNIHLSFSLRLSFSEVFYSSMKAFSHMVLFQAYNCPASSAFQTFAYLLKRDPASRTLEHTGLREDKDQKFSARVFIFLPILTMFLPVFKIQARIPLVILL